MGQEKQTAAKGQESLRKATDTLSTMLAQEVKDLNARQRAARRENSTDPGIMKGPVSYTHLTLPTSAIV